MFSALTRWARTQTHIHTPAERAARLLWSPEVLEISDEQFAEIGRVLGLEELATPQHRITVSP